jgi:hypothetical protein
MLSFRIPSQVVDMAMLMHDADNLLALMHASNSFLAFRWCAGLQIFDSLVNASSPRFRTA